MSYQYPEDLKYSDTHEYVRLEENVAIIGISSFAVQQLGEIVFVEIQEVGSVVTKGDSFGSIESVKAVEDIKAPVSGTIIERNESIIDDPEMVNDDPYGDGWLIKVRVDNPSEIDDALSASQYSALVEGQ